MAFPTLAKAAQAGPFPETHVAAGKGLYAYADVIDLDDPEQKPLKNVREVDVREGWVEFFVSDGSGHIVIDKKTETFKTNRRYGNFELRWRRPATTSLPA